MYLSFMGRTIQATIRGCSRKLSNLLRARRSPYRFKPCSTMFPISLLCVGLSLSLPPAGSGLAGVFSRGLCFSECCDTPMPAQTKKGATDYGAGPLAFMLMANGDLQCAAMVHPQQPEVSLRRKTAPRAQTLPARAGVGEEEEEKEEEGEGTDVEVEEDGEEKVQVGCV